MIDDRDDKVTSIIDAVGTTLPDKRKTVEQADRSHHSIARAEIRLRVGLATTTTTSMQNSKKTKQLPQWQDVMNFKRLWNGDKKAAVKVGEHFTE